MADSQVVVPGGDRAVAREPVDPALDRMPLLVVVLLELGRTPREPSFWRLRIWSDFPETLHCIPFQRSLC
ncbi:hypothetical protein [Streptomyces sp. NPDC056949]|uniref:hypothetical protein n=1 Tax=Streptomyces sp. NPDC056949 TaxID=3345976 RepID=UPI00363986C1